MISRVGKCIESIRRFWWLLPLLAIPLSAWTHAKAGYTFPSPWPDEAVFIWPAQAFSETGSLQSDSMNPERAIWWHPPGYQWFLGLMFCLVEPGIENARWISWILITLAYLGLIAVFNREHTFRFEVVIMLSIFYLNGHAVIAGNVARPEALIIAMNVWAYFLMVRGKPWAALSINGLSLICHPTGAFFILGNGILFLAQYGIRWPKPSRREWMVLIAALGVLACTMALLLPQWDIVLRDLNVSVTHNKETLSTRLERIIQPRVLIPVILMALVSIDALFIRKRNRALVVLGWVSWSIIHIRPEMWYTAHHALAYAIFSTLLVISIADRFSFIRREGIRTVATMGVLASMIFGLFIIGHAPDPRHYPTYFWWYHMTIRDRAAYHEEVDIQRTVEVLSELPRKAESPLRVQFIPGGEGALYTGVLPDGMIPYYPVFSDTPPDAYIVRISAMTYPGFRQDAQNWINKLSIDDRKPYHARDGEAWYMALHAAEQN